MVASVEERLAELEREVRRISDRMGRVERERGLAAAPSVATVVPAAPLAATPLPVAATPAPPARMSTPRDLEELLGGRVLALVGGVAVLIGLAFLVGLAIDHGWIDERMRVALAFLGSATLVGVGVWLAERRRRTQAALAIAGTGLAGLFLSLCAASALYDLVPTPAALAGALGAGAAGAALAVRWATRTLAALAMLGALAAPIFVGAFPSLEGVAFLAVACAAAAALLVWRRWEWLRLAVFSLASTQVAVWAVATDHTVAVVLVVLALFGVLTAVAALGYEVRVPRVAIRASTSLLVASNAVVTGGIASLVLGDDDRVRAAGVWMLGIAFAHLAAAVATSRLARESKSVALLLGGVALTSADLALALLADGPVLATGWALGAGALAAVVRRHAEPMVAPVALGAQLALAIGHALLFDASPSALVDGAPVAFAPLLAIALAAFACARLALPGAERWRAAADGVALAMLAYVTALALDGTALVLAFGGQALALGAVGRRTGEALARLGSFGLLGLAALHALAFEAPPAGLVQGLDELGAAALALGGVAASAVWLARSEPAPGRGTLVLVAGVALAYLASLAIVTAFQPGPHAPDAGLGLDVRQQGQALLSVFWSALGLALLWLGLRDDRREVRLCGFALLAIAVAKVFLFDMAALESGYRVLSFVVLGVLLLAGAYAYQRLRQATTRTGASASAA